MNLKGRIIIDYDLTLLDKDHQTKVAQDIRNIKTDLGITLTEKVVIQDE